MYNNNNRGGYRQNNNQYGNNNGGGYRQNNYGNNGGGYQQPKKKRTSCKAGNDKNGNPYVRGWNASKTHGSRSFLAVPTSKTGQHKSKSGKVWENWMVKVQPKGGQPYTVSGLYDAATRRIIIQDLQFVMNPNKDYCGTYVRRKN